jgi:hypothetical protein
MTNDDGLLDILGVVEREDVISNLLCHAFVQLPDLRRRLLRQIDKLPDPDLRSVRGMTRVGIPGVGVPDIVLVGESTHGHEAIIIENKLGAAEGAGQTEAYTNSKAIEVIRNRFSLPADPRRHFIFLTVMPDQDPAEDSFTHLTYQSLFEGYISPDGSSVGRLLEELRDHVDRALQARNVSPNLPMKDAINPQAPFDAGYLAFQSIIEELPLPSDLTVVGRYRGSARGRRHYGALIQLGHWAPRKMDPANVPVHGFEPRRHVNIHFEPQAHVLSGGVTLYLHYEINPYKTKSWAEKHLPAPAYDEYRAVRSQFYRELRKALPRGWSFRKGSNMLAKIPFSKSATVREVADGMTDAMAEATPVIDNLLAEIVFEST